MSEVMMMDVEEIEVYEDEGFHIEDDRGAEYALKRIRETQEEVDKFKAYYDASIKKMQSRADGIRNYYESHLRKYFENVPHKATKTQESYELPSAKLVLKAQAPEFVREDDEIMITQAGVKAGKTTPPKSYTEDTLLSAMEKAGSDETPDEAERKGLGTPATRAGIIEKLVRIGFIERKGDKKTKYLVPTHKGEALITVIPEAIQSASMTAEWEQKLKQVERGELAPDVFLREITDMVGALVRTSKAIPGAEVLFPSGRKVIGKCPRCGSDVTESKKGFFCERNDCRFGLWRDNKFLTGKKINLTEKLAAALLRGEPVPVKGIYSEKTGKTYDADISLEDNGSAVRYRLSFPEGGK